MEYPHPPLIHSFQVQLIQGILESSVWGAPRTPRPYRRRNGTTDLSGTDVRGISPCKGRPRISESSHLYQIMTGENRGRKGDSFFPPFLPLSSKTLGYPGGTMMCRTNDSLGVRPSVPEVTSYMQEVLPTYESTNKNSLLVPHLAPSLCQVTYFLGNLGKESPCQLNFISTTQVS